MGIHCKFLQFHAISYAYHLDNQLQANKIQDIIHLAKDTPSTLPYKSSRKRKLAATSMLSNEKLEIKEFTATLTPNKQQELDDTQSQTRH